MAQARDPLKALPKDERERLVEHVQQYFRDERDEELGELAAELLMAFMGELVGPVYYNRALEDARKAAMEQGERLQADLMALEKPLERRE